MRILLAALFLFSAASVARFAYAGYLARRDSPPDLARAARLVRSAEYAQRLAELDPDCARGALEHAIAWNPQSSAARIALGLEEERSGDLASAERDLLAAADLDRQYLPAWTLTNFYFRHEDHDRFARWANRAGELCPGDLQPLLILCDRIAPGNATALLPPRKIFVRAYLDLLIAHSRWQDARAAARKLSGDGDPEDARRLAALTTRLIDARQFEEAIEVWHDLDPAGEPPVNGDFRRAPTGGGFDWRTPPADGIDASWTSGELTFRFTGHQPDACVLLEQPIPLDRGRYTLEFDYEVQFEDRSLTRVALFPTLNPQPGRARQQAESTGLRWTLDSRESPEIALTGLMHWNFAAAQGGVRWLRLIYRRDPGAIAAHQRFSLRAVRLTHQEVN